MYATLTHADSLQQLVNDTKNPAMGAQLQELALQPLSRLLRFHAESVESDAGIGEDVQQLQLLQLLRAARNLSAFGEDMTHNLMRNDIDTLVFSILRKTAFLEPDQSKSSGDVIKLALQMVANMTTSSSSSGAVVWEALFPHTLSSVIERQSGLQPIVAAVLFGCVRSGAVARQEMVTVPGINLLRLLLVEEVRGAHCDPRLQHLVGEAAITRGQLGPLLRGLNPIAKAIALHLCYSYLEELGENFLLDASASTSLGSALCQMFEESGMQVVSAQSTGSMLPQSSDTQPTINCPEQTKSDSVADVLEWILRVLVALTSVASSKSSCQDSSPDLVDHMLQVGLVDSLLAALATLPAITKPAGEAASVSGHVSHRSKSQPPANRQHVAGAQAGDSQDAKQSAYSEASQLPWPVASVYTGYRTDLVAVLANMSFGHSSVQLHMCTTGGVQLLLEQCQIDDDSPLVREHALWGIRNVCGNSAAQDLIGDLQVLGPAQDEALTRAGFQIRLDSATNRPRMVRDKHTQREASIDVGSPAT